MIYIEAPQVATVPVGQAALFVGGGITGTHEWQSGYIDLLSHLDLLILNPRRAEFNIEDESESEKQIQWEWDALAKSTMVSFWFPSETLCPITLLELGIHLAGDKPIFVGCDQYYQRKLDLEIQCGLYRPEIEIVYSIEDLAGQVKRFVESINE